MRNLVVCCDGTWNTPEDMDHGLPSPTNVVKLYNGLIRDQTDKQDAYYHPGVGTGKGWWDRVAGGGTGAGLDQNIVSAYRWLAGQYKPDDQIFLFGFSRGAYTVRSLGGLIAKCGLVDASGMKPEEVWTPINEVFAAYRKGLEFTNPKNYPFHNVAAGAATKETTPIYFIGVWDTVGALGIPDDLALLGLLDSADKYRFHDTALSHIVQHARHAVAMDERRASFAPTLWSNVPAAADVQQIWFPGVHSDVGGGYLETGLSDGALSWMFSEAKKQGLMLWPKVQKQLNPNAQGILHDSCTGVFKVLKTRPRTNPQIPDEKAALHKSTIERNSDPSLSQGNYWETKILKQGKKQTVDVFAIEHWNHTGLYLEAGVTYDFVATGQWVDQKDRFSAAGEEAGGFHLGDIARFASSLFGEAETAFKNVTGREADFWWTRRDEDAPWFSLMGFIASDHGEDAKTLAAGETFKIGEGRSYTPKGPGYLYCYANDAWQAYGNNRGSVSLTVSRPK